MYKVYEIEFTGDCITITFMNNYGATQHRILFASHDKCFHVICTLMANSITDKERKP